MLNHNDLKKLHSMNWPASK